MKTIAYAKKPSALWFWVGSVLLAAAALFASRPAQADIYFWEDSQGVIHFSNGTAPPEAKLYLQEKESTASSQHPEVISTESADTAVEQRQRFDESNAIAKLEEAEERLESALERVSGLTEQITDTQERLHAAEADAQEARHQAELQQISDQHADESKTIVYYNKPYRNHYRYKKHHRKPGTYYNYRYGRHKKDWRHKKEYRGSHRRHQKDWRHKNQIKRSSRQHSTIYKNFYRRPVVPERGMSTPSRRQYQRIR